MADVEENTAAVKNESTNGDEKVEEPVAQDDSVKEESVPEEKPEDENGEKPEEDKEVPLTSQEKSIIRQIEYYFGDANLNRDKYLCEQISLDPNGWVPLSVLLTFKRLAALSTDPEVILNALNKSDEGLVEISEDRTKLRRHPERPLPEHNDERRKEIQSRTAYAKGFPLDATLDQILEYFAPYEKVANVTMRKYHDRKTKQYKFKGSIFVTFEKAEQTKDFIEKKKVTYQDRDLLRKWQTDYHESKREEKEAKLDKAKAKTAKEEEPPFELPTGTVFAFEKAGDDVTRELLRETIKKILPDEEIAFIDHSKGNESGFVRFHEKNAAVEFLAKLEGNVLKLKEDEEVQVRLLEGEEESTYLNKAVQNMKNIRTQRKNNFKNKRRGNQNHHYGKKKRLNAN